jgi:murein DD-endopeptidase MepM/ murein hydrolase activator NlpD
MQVNPNRSTISPISLSAKPVLMAQATAVEAPPAGAPLLADKSASEEVVKRLPEALLKASFFPVVGSEGYSLGFGVVNATHKTPHTGLDIAAKLGSPVVSLMAGEIVALQTDEHGSPIIVVRSGDVEVTYAHLNEFVNLGVGNKPYLKFKDKTFKVGDQLVAGEPFGTVGSRGNSTGPHLHISVKGTLTDKAGRQSPEFYIDPKILFNKAKELGGLTVLEPKAPASK